MHRRHALPRRPLAVDIRLEAFNLLNHAYFALPSAILRPVPPNNSRPRKPLMDARLGLPLERWFSPTPTRWSPAEF